MKRTLSIALAVLVVLSSAACIAQPSVPIDTPPVETELPAHSSTPSAETETPTPAPKPTDDPDPDAQEDPQEPDLTPIPPLYDAIAGVVIGFEGPVDENGDIPWDNDWFRFKIETNGGQTTSIVGVHDTAILLGASPEIGMSIVAYVPREVHGWLEGGLRISTTYATPVFRLEGETVIIATAIVGSTSDVAVCGFRRERGFYVSNDGTFRFIADENTRVRSSNWPSPWAHEPVGWDVFEASGVFEMIPFSRGMANLAVFYDTNAEGIAVATDVVILDDYLPLVWWTYDSANPLDFVFADNMYTRDDFLVSDLPIILNGEQTDLQALVGLGGVFVPFRRIFLHVGFGNLAHLDNEGSLHFGGGGGGSENSFWTVGVPHVQVMGGKYAYGLAAHNC